MEWLRYGRGTVFSRYTPGSLVVWYAQGSFAPGIALHASSLDTLPFSLPSDGSRISRIMQKNLQIPTTLEAIPFLANYL